MGVSPQSSSGVGVMGAPVSTLSPRRKAAPDPAGCSGAQHTPRWTCALQTRPPHMSPRTQVPPRSRSATFLCTLPAGRDPSSQMQSWPCVRLGPAPPSLEHTLVAGPSFAPAQPEAGAEVVLQVPALGTWTRPYFPTASIHCQHHAVSSLLCGRVRCWLWTSSALCRWPSHFCSPPGCFLGLLCGTACSLPLRPCLMLRSVLSTHHVWGCEEGSFLPEGKVSKAQM